VYYFRMRTLFRLPYLSTERLILKKKEPKEIELHQALGLNSESQNEVYGIALKEGPKEIIGYVSFEKHSSRANKVELSYVLTEKHWDKGYATEVAKCLILFCFEDFQISQIKSKRLSEKVLAKVSLVKHSYLDRGLQGELFGDWPNKTSIFESLLEVRQ
jgi:RimJ/RimL family protein N-acetyltransferase